MKKYTSQGIKEFVSKPLFDEKIILNKDPNYPRISIVTPSYNQAQFLERTILSVLNQNYPNLEYIIIDGDSRDGSVEIIKKYEKYLTYWVSEPDKGQSHAIKKGFEKSTGDIMAYLNSDDTYCPGTISKIVKLFTENQNVDIIYGAINLINEKDEVLARRDMSPSKFAFSVLLFESSIPQQATFWKRDIYLKSGGIDPNFSFCMDLDLWVRFKLSGGKFLKVNIVSANFRSHPLSKSNTMDNIREKERLFITEKVLGRKIGAMEWKYRYFINKSRRYLSNPLDLFRGIIYRMMKKLRRHR